MKIDIREISSQETWPIRSTVLRHGLLPLEKTANPNDNAPGSFHLGAFMDLALIGITSFQQETLDATHLDLNRNPEFKHFFELKHPYRMRGMAVLENYRKYGIGKQLIHSGLEILKKQTCEFIWFNARIGAIPFYQNLNFQIVSDVFMILGHEDIGPHHVMAKILKQS